MRKIEILAPAGSFESLKAAVNAGCDAVYIGGSHFGARAFADNLTKDQMLEAIDYMHLHDKKLYLTVNTLLKERELEEELIPFLKPYYEQGLDAVIVQDIGAMKRIHENFTDLSIHASTQMSLTSEKGANLLRPLGVTRFVPARELTLKEIKRMREGTALEIECFVHGALCYCYSGQCLLSSMIGGRSGNRGRCAQPCRMMYELEESGRKGYFLSPKDIRTLALLPDLIEAGIDSFKIEGRMKRSEYAALCSHLYGKYTDLYLEKGRDGFERFKKDHRQEWEDDQKALAELYNRGGFSSGYYLTDHKKSMMSVKRPNHFGVLTGTVLQVKGNQARILFHEEIHAQDILEIRDEEENSLYEYTVGKDILAKESVWANFKKGSKISINDKVYRTRNQKQLDWLKEVYLLSDKKIAIEGNFVCVEEQPFQLTLRAKGKEVTVYGETVELAQNQPLEKNKIIQAIGKIQNTAYQFKALDGYLSQQAFFPAGAVKNIRREALAALRESLLKEYRRKAKEECKKEEQFAQGNTGKKIENRIHVLVSNREQFEVLRECKEVERIYVPPSLFMEMEQCVSEKEIYISLPYIFRSNTFDTFSGYNFTGCDGFLVRNYEEIAFLKEKMINYPIVLDSNVYTFNSYAKDYWRENGIVESTVPLELNAGEIKERGAYGDELFVYGHLPLMITAQCLTDYAFSCKGQPARQKILDRKGKVFYFINFCEYCYNILYEGEAYSLLEEKKMVEEIGPASIRLAFTWETKEETHKILKNFIDTYRYKISNDKMENTVKGHFRRGVE